MSALPEDVYTEPQNIDVDTLRNLGPLTGMAGICKGTSGLDVKPKVDGARTQAYVDRIELQSIDPQVNGPQLFYGLRYHQHVVRPDHVKTYHDQVGYWLWEPATGTVAQTLTTPGAVTVLAMGQAAADATSFELIARREPAAGGICSAPLLEYAFRVVEYHIKINRHADGTWSYDEDAVLMIKGQREPFHHTDRNTLTKIGEPTLELSGEGITRPLVAPEFRAATDPGELPASSLGIPSGSASARWRWPDSKAAA